MADIDIRDELEAGTPASQYSNESVVIDDDFGDLSRLEQTSPDQNRASKVKSTRFNMRGSVSYPDVEFAEPQKNKNPSGAQLMSLQDQLRSRLYDKPENSGVVQYVKMQTVRKRPVSQVSIQL